LDYESRLARRIASRKNTWRAWLTYLGAAMTIFIVMNLASESLAAPHAVIHIGTRSSFAMYLGQFDGEQNAMMLGVLSIGDWICLKLPFKGHLSDLSSLSFSEFVSKSPGQYSLEPYAVIRMSEGKNLVCHPTDSYASEDWTLPLFEWQARELATKGMWRFAPTDTESLLLPLSEWLTMIGDGNVLSINLYVGCWDIASPYQCYIGDITVNGCSIDLSNAGRCTGSISEMPLGF
jgi:hypothetical protein